MSQVFTQYLSFRKASNINGCLSLVSDKIVLVSQKDGKFEGKEQFAKYLKMNPYQGEWGEAYWSDDDNMWRVDGRAKILFIKIKVKILCKLNNNNQIEYVYVGRT